MKYKAKILAVDDIDENLQVLGNILSLEGYDISFANEGREALAIAAELKPDLILLDIAMPGMDGYEVCSELKKNEHTHSVPVIFLTAKSDQKSKIEGFTVGAADYVTKPFNFNELLARVKVHIDLKKSKDVINEQNIALKETLESKEQLFSIITHDLKSPFSGLLSLTDLLMSNFDNKSPDTIKSQLEVVNQSVKNTYNLLENLVEWRKLQSGKLEIESSVFPFSELLEKSTENIQWMALTKKQNLKIDAPEDLEIQGDINMLTTVLRNLISNAIKFSPPSGEIIISAKRENGEYLLTVKDEGVGMKKEMVNTLWNSDIKKSSLGTGNEKGTGLGLLFIHSFIKKHNGTIEVESQKNKGTTFWIRIPAPS